jgi:hypothetical protein
MKNTQNRHGSALGACSDKKRIGNKFIYAICTQRDTIIYSLLFLTGVWDWQVLYP